MIINKILNNNVIVTLDEDGKEIVAMGRGIAFGKRVGGEVQADKVEKVYRLKSSGMQEKFETLLAGISTEYLTVTTKIVELAEEKLNMTLNESIYIAMTDHIHGAVQRLKEGIVVHNMMLWELRRFYPQEFAIGLQGIELMKKTFDIEVSEDEAGFLAMHLINGEQEQGNVDAGHIIKMVNELASIVRRVLGMDFDRESLAYYRFITHLKFFAGRIEAKKETKDDIDAEMAEMIKQKYARAFAVAEKIAAFVKVRYHYDASADEVFYLTVHIAKLMRQCGKSAQ